LKSKSYVKLGDVVDEITVGWVGTMSNEYVDEGIPFLRSLNVKPYEISFKNMKFISKEFHEKIKKSALHPGDVVVVRTGNAGIASLISDELQIANCSDLVIIRPGEKIDANFLVSYLNSKSGIDNIAGRLVGSVQRHFNIGDAKSLEIPNTSIDTQKKISDILVTLKNKITILENQNRTLEQMAQAIFQSWFVDFDGVTEFEDSELGKIPKGWNIDILENIFTLEYGWHLPKWNRENGNVPVYGSGGLTGFHNKSFVKGPGIIVGRAGKIGKDSIYHSLNDFCPIETTFYVKTQNQTLISYLYYFLKELNIIDTGSSVPNLSRKTVHNLKILIPSKNSIKTFNNIIENIFLKIKITSTQIESLTKTRDALLPKLMSGEIRV